MDTVVAVIFVIVAIIQIAMIFTFFGMASTLKNIESYLFRMATHSGALEAVRTGSVTGPNQPWVCPKCKHQNAYWDKTCKGQTGEFVCGEPRA